MTDNLTTIANRFDELFWHDSKLLELSVYRSASDERVRLRVSLRQLNDKPRLVDVIFLQSSYFDAELDLDGKRVCSDDISSGSCFVSSTWLQELTRSNPHDSFEGYLHFRIDLIPPGGKINILAKDFVVGDPSE